MKELKKDKVTTGETSSSEKTNSTIPYARWNNPIVAWTDFDEVSSLPSSSQGGKQIVQDDGEEDADDPDATESEEGDEEDSSASE